MRNAAREAALNIIFAQQFNTDCFDQLKKKICKQFGLEKDETLTRLDQRRKTAQAAVTENSKANLLSTTDGNGKLETFLGSANGAAWLTANGLSATTNFASLSADNKDKLADSFMQKLQIEANAADEEYRENEKIFSFIYQIEQAAGIKRLNSKGKDDVNADISVIDVSKGSEEYKNYFDYINSLIKNYDEELGITTGDNPLFENGTKEFNLQHMAELMRDAEAGNTLAAKELNKIYKDWDKIKTLKSRVTAVENKDEYQRNIANDKFNSGK